MSKLPTGSGIVGAHLFGIAGRKDSSVSLQSYKVILKIKLKNQFLKRGHSGSTCFYI